MKKTTITILVITLLVVSVLAVRFIFGGSEDDWICVDGQWVQHGVPSAPKPTTPCGEPKQVASFEDCVAAGNPVMESYPRQCRHQGQTFVENIGNELEKTDLIRVETPRPNQIVSSPLIVKGEARGYWFFEASFPIKLVDQEGNQLALGIAQAQNDWMTENFVPFEAELTFDVTKTGRAKLILEKDNPSGLSENADQLEIPIIIDFTLTACQINQDCQLPMEYAVQSNCPYSVACQNNQCMVICPMWYHSPSQEESVSYKVACENDLDCDCTIWDKNNKYTCACIDGQCASVIAR